MARRTEGRTLDFAIDSSWRVMLLDLGINVSDLLATTNLPADTLSKPGNRLCSSDYFRLWNGVQAALQDPAAPLLIGKAAVQVTFEPSVFAALCSPNVKVACHRLARYKRLFAPMQLLISDQRAGFKIVFDWSTFPDVPMTLIATEFAYFVSFARHATRHHVVLQLVETTAEIKLDRSFDRFWGVAATTSNVNAITFSQSDAVRPFFTENEAMWNVFEPELRRRLASLDNKATTQQRVKGILLEGLPSGQASMKQIAKRLSTSERTLQRQLQRDNTSFQLVVSQTRRELAMHYLTNTTHTASEISFLLGYEDPNSFFRAFADWTGKSPQQVRNEHVD